MKKKIPTFLKALKMKNRPHPGFSVRVDCLEPHGLSVTEGAKVLGVSRSALSHLVNESADLRMKRSESVYTTIQFQSESVSHVTVDSRCR